MAKTNYIPQGYHTATPYLIVHNAKEALSFYQRAFGAKEVERHEDPTTGKIMHSEIEIGDSRIAVADEHPQMGIKSAKTLGGTPVSILLYVPDVDAVVGQAIKAGATLTRPVADQFYGDRSGGVTDPFGHSWYVHTHKEDVSAEEMERRMKAMATQKK